MDENQREYYLKERLKAINDELGENMLGDSDLAEELDKYTEKVDELQLSEENEQKLKRKLKSFLSFRRFLRRQELFAHILMLALLCLGIHLRLMKQTLQKSETNLIATTTE